MKIIIGYPPNYEAISEVFDIADREVSFIYGDILYNPHNGPVDEAFLAHEATHIKQQREYGSVEGWWSRYLKDKDFRLRQEMEAYRNQYKVAKRIIKDRNELNLKAIAMARDLSSEIYGNMINPNVALREIRL
jgi:hypothetical protein